MRKKENERASCVRVREKENERASRSLARSLRYCGVVRGAWCVGARGTFLQKKENQRASCVCVREKGNEPHATRAMKESSLVCVCMHVRSHEACMACYYT